MTVLPWVADLGPAGGAGGLLGLVFACGLSGLLLWAAAADLRHRRIPNASCAGIAASWVLFALFGDGPATTSWALLGAAGVFAVSFLLWDRGVLGGGDVKLLTALALWAGGGGLLAPFLLITAVSGGWLAVAWLSARRAGLILPARVAVGLSWAGLPVLPGDPRGLPYGVAIGLGGAWLVGRLFWH